MHYSKQPMAFFMLVLGTACGRPEMMNATPSHISTDANADYAYVPDAQEGNIRVVTHISNNSAQGGNAIVDANVINAHMAPEATTATPSPTLTPDPVHTPGATPPAPTPTPIATATSPDDGNAVNANSVATNTGVTGDTNTPATDTNSVSMPPAGNTNTVTAAVRYLVANGNRITWNDGTAWQGRGANIQDARGCGACVYTDLTESTNEVLRRIDALTDDWHANFLRLTLESDTTPDILQNANYLASISTIVAHVMQKPGVVLEVSLWIDPSFNSMGWPTAATTTTWQQLVRTIGQYPRVMFGIANEPQYNSNGAFDGNVWSAMNAVSQGIRDQEKASGFMQHIIVAQGTGGWARYLQYYTTHPLTAGDGNNFAYEVHVYDAASTFQSRFETPSQTIPVIIGEFGPADGAMTIQDCTALMDTADALGVPYMGWTAHMRCPPSMLEDNSEGSCGIGMPLDPTAWGQLLIDHLAANAQ